MTEHSVGLCIVHRNHNYGGILQSYATIMKMEELGAHYEIIDYQHPKSIRFYAGALISSASRVAVYSKLRALRKKVGKRIHREYAANVRIRDQKFREFTNERFHGFSKPIRDYEELQAYARKYTDVLVGSDQMWLPSGLGTNFYNLMFAPDDCNKIAYASSFGVADIPKNQRDRTREYLNRIQHISVREQAGQKIVKELTGRDVPVILDPTMIVTREQWDEAIPDTNVVDGKYIFCYFLGNNPEHRKEVLKLKEKTGLNIVTLKHIDEYIPADEHFGDLSPYDVGPAEFVNLIRHAEYVCTDSFHGSVFSIIYHKPFISFNRFSEGKNSRNSRLDTLFQNIGISRRFRHDLVQEMLEPIAYHEVDMNIRGLREAACSFIEDALGCKEKHHLQTAAENEGTSHIICSETDCTGCFACSAVCPQNAIAMKMDRNGFWRPAINSTLCVECQKCNRVCPANTSPEVYGPTEAFAYQNADSIRFESTSGGFFHAVASMIFAEGGVVCGAAFDQNMVLHHVFAETGEELGKLQKSKYVQSSLEGVYQRIRQYLEDGRKVLFVGTGCQAAALRKYIGEDNHLIVMDVVCYGVPSSGLFRDWIAYLEKKYGKVADVRFRDKTYGYASPNVKVQFENGRYIESCRDSNLFTDLFFRHLSIRNSCLKCRYKTIDRTSDLTLGDCWSIGSFDASKDDNKGTTVAFAHTETGRAICKSLHCIQVDLEKMVHKDAAKMVECVAPSHGASGFWLKYQEDGFEKTVQFYVRNGVKSKVKYGIKRLANRTGVSVMWYKRAKKRALHS